MPPKRPSARAAGGAWTWREWRGAVGPPLLLFVALSAVAVGAAVAQRSAQRDRLRGQVEAAAVNAAHSLESQVEGTLNEVRAVRERLRAGRVASTFPPAARSLTARDTNVRQLLWADVEGDLLYVVPQRETKDSATKRSASRELAWVEGWRPGRDEGRDAVASYRAGAGEVQVRCVLPVGKVEDEQAESTAAAAVMSAAAPATTHPDGFRGALLARVRLDRKARDATAGWWRDVCFQLVDEGALLYGPTPGGPAAAPTTEPADGYVTASANQPPGDFLWSGPLVDPASRASGEASSAGPPFAWKHLPPVVGKTYVRVPVHVLNRQWELEAAPSDALVARVLDRSPWYVAVFGVVAAGLFSAMLFQLLYGRAKQDWRHRQYLRALERLSDVATTINSRLDAPRETLDLMARAARQLLEMDRAGVALLDRGGEGLRVVAAAGDVPRELLQPYNLGDLPLCRSVLKSRRPLFIGDVSRSNARLNERVVERYDARSLVLLPLGTGDRQFGLLAVSSSEPREFSDEQRRVAELLASKAAVVLSNSDLYGRMAEALRNQQVLFEQREAIFAVNAAVYQAATLQESLQMIAELAPGVLGVDLCMVTLNGDTEDRVRVAAITKPHGENLVGKNFIRRGTNTEVVRATRRALVIDEAGGHPGVHPAFTAQVDIGSIAYMPLLRTGGSFIGTLVLVRHKPGPFSPEQLNLAELFTVRAAAAIENAELLEQTRRDAQAKTMLLRELNHRVKNNLASIITLLSLDEPDLSPRARQWLHRAIDRIRTMARTHDLFSGGIDRVRLADLVQQTIPSLSVVRPTSVDVRVDVKADVTLRTDRAVSLAMALHELCYNAIIHGLGGDAGTVTIRAQLQELAVAGPVPQRGVLLEVVDNATASRRAAAAAEAVSSEEGNGVGLSVATKPAVELRPLPVRVGSGGLGLMLVDGLVTRELNGQFSLERTDEGTVARVWFPVGPEDAAG